MQSAARFNPVNWAVVAGREALTTDPDWNIVWPRMVALVGFVIFCGWLAVRAFRVYRRSI